MRSSLHALKLGADVAALEEEEMIYSSSKPWLMPKYQSGDYLETKDGLRILKYVGGEYNNLIPMIPTKQEYKLYRAFRLKIYKEKKK